MDLSTISTEELMKMRDAPQGPDLSKMSTEELMKMRGSDQPDPTGSFFENVAAGAGKAITDIGRGAGQFAREQIETGPMGAAARLVTGGRSAKLANTFSLPTQADITEARRLDEPLSKTAGGTVGQIAAVVPAAFIPGAGTYAGAATIGGALGLLQPTVEGESRELNTAIGAGFGVAGKFAGDKVASTIGKMFSKAETKVAQTAARNVERDATFKAGRQLGLVAPPSQTGGGVASRSLEGFSNKTSVAQTASVQNQEVVNQVARKTLSLTDDAPLNEATYAAFRDQAAEPYRQVAAISKQAANTLEKLKETRLEAKLHHNYFNRQGDPAALKQANFFDGKAEALEDRLEKFALKAGSPDLIEELRSARTLIAKSHTLENATLEGTGNVSAAKIAQSLNKGVPLTDEMRTIAKFANKFPKAMQNPDKIGSVPMFTLTDVAMGSAGALANPALGALSLARPAARNIALSSPMQNSLASPNYSVGTALRAANAAAPMLRKVLPAATVGAALSDRR